MNKTRGEKGRGEGRERAREVVKGKECCVECSEFQIALMVKWDYCLKGKGVPAECSACKGGVRGLNS